MHERRQGREGELQTRQRFFCPLSLFLLHPLPFLPLPPFHFQFYYRLFFFHLLYRALAHAPASVESSPPSPPSRHSSFISKRRRPTRTHNPSFSLPSTNGGKEKKSRQNNVQKVSSGSVTKFWGRGGREGRRAIFSQKYSQTPGKKSAGPPAVSLPFFSCQF